MQSLYPFFFFSLLCIIFAQTMEQGKYPYFYVFFNVQGSDMLLCNLSIHLFYFLFFHFYVSFSHRPWSKVSIYTFMSFSTCKKVIWFYAISISIFFFFSLLCIIFAQTMEQGKYPDFYVFFNMRGSNMLLCNLSIHFFFSLLCIIFAQTKVSIRTLMSSSKCKEVICFYAISLSIFFHFYVSFRIDHGAW